MTSSVDVRVHRAYDPPAQEDGTRVLVDRLWPRGLARDRAELASWCKDIAPSTELRHWYGHDPDLYTEFVERYRAELADEDHAPALAELRELAAKGTLTLLTSVKAIDISHAVVLAQVLTEQS